MRTIEIKETLQLPVDKAWKLFVQLENYPKYFKYVNRIFYKEKMSLGSNWYDFATFIIPVIVKHKTTVFEKNQKLGFDVHIPIKGYVRERINFEKKGNATGIYATIVFDFGNPLFSLLFDDIFEKRMKESISGALKKLTEELGKTSKN
jgi:uncharacterized membrane protein